MFFRERASELVCLVATLLAAASAAGAQQLRGVVRAAPSAQPVAGAVVALVRANGSTVAQMLTDRGGAYRLTVDTAARRILVRRIGFLPIEMALPDSAHNRAVVLDVTLHPVPSILPAVVTTQAGCRSAKAAGQALALFEQARYGLLATIAAREVNPAVVKLARFSRTGLNDGDMLQTLSLTSGVSTRPFGATLSPERMSANGFMTPTAAGRVFHGLDAELLLSDAFRATHCFDMAPSSRDHRGQLGIAFTPTQDRTRMIEVSGTIWLDPTPLALRSLEYRYENATSADRDADAGGTFAFRTLSNGVVLIEDWQIRIHAGAFETLEVAPAFGVDTDAGLIPSRPSQSIRAALIQVEGGSVLSARWLDGDSLVRRMPAVEGIVRERGTGRPIPNAHVRLMSTPYRTVTNADGSFRMADVVPGRYQLAVIDSLWEPFGLGRPVYSIVRVEPDGTAKVTVQLDERVKLTQKLCDLMQGSHGPAMVAMRLVDSLGNPAPGQVSWRSDQAWKDEETTTQQTSTKGQLWACGFRGGEFTFKASIRGAADSVKLTLPDTGVTAITITVKTPR